MADNVIADPGAGGATFATDDIAGVHYPRSKVVWGPDGTVNDADVASGKPLPVQLREPAGTDVALSAKLGALTESAPATDTASSGLNGRLQRIAQRLTSLIALLPAALTGAGSFKVSVEEAVVLAAVVGGTVTANAGTNLNTSALALEAGGNLAGAATSLAILDDWDEADRAKVNIVSGQAGITAGAGAVAASTPRVTLASDDPAVVALQIIDDWDETDRAKVNTIAGQVGVQGGSGASTALTQRVVLATDVGLPAGTAVLGTVTSQHGKTIKTVSGSLTADTDVIALVSSKRLKVIAYSLISVGTNANTVIFKSNGTSGTELWRVLLQSSTAIAAGANLAIAAPSFLFATVAGEKLTMDVSQSDTVHYSITYFDDDTT